MERVFYMTYYRFVGSWAWAGCKNATSAPSKLFVSYFSAVNERLEYQDHSVQSTNMMMVFCFSLVFINPSSSPKMCHFTRSLLVSQGVGLWWSVSFSQKAKHLVCSMTKNLQICHHLECTEWNRLWFWRLMKWHCNLGY